MELAGDCMQEKAILDDLRQLRNEDKTSFGDNEADFIDAVRFRDEDIWCTDTWFRTPFIHITWSHRCVLITYSQLLLKSV